MPSALGIQQFERRLIELGCPAAQLRRRVQELADHHEDLKQAAREEGLSEAEAQVRADELLGEPIVLAEHLALALRQSSWWGRHRIIGFCLLPPLAIFTTSLLGLLSALGLLRLCFSADEWTILADEGPGFTPVVVAVEGACYMAIAFMAILFCWLARRSASGLKWAMAACAVCSIQSYFVHCQIMPHAVTLGYASSPNWICALIPLLVAVTVFARHWQFSKRLAPFLNRAGTLRVRPKAASAALCCPKPGLVKTFCASPTYWVMAVMIPAITMAGLWVRAEYLRQTAQARTRQELKTSIWPAERAAVAEEVKARQRTKDTVHETIIDLKPYLNAALTNEGGLPVDPTVASAGANDNNLAELPAGVHIFGGVPFDVQGKVQLMGRGVLKSNRIFPSKVKGIRIAQKCRKLHLLHGARFLDSSDSRVSVGRMILHYSDGSQREIAIVSGEHVLDWWGPVMKTDIAEDQRSTTSPGTELAWIGSNPQIRHSHPDWSVRLYKGTFDNPQPDVEITSMDYVSTLTQAAPFLVGLTVE